MNKRIERVIAIDPGKLTGMAVLERYKDDEKHEVRLLESVEANPDECIPLLREWLSTYGQPVEPGQPPVRVAMESFLITVETGKKSQEAAWALETIGAVKQTCRDVKYPVGAIAFFRPSQKSVFPNTRLKKLGIWHVGGKGHALDAIRHGMLYLMQTGMLPQTARE